MVFYAYSAVIANIVDKTGGTSTDFFGDGVLNLFDVNDNRADAFIRTMRAAREILNVTLNVMNPIFEKALLPKIDIGLGIDFGDTIVTRFGYKSDNDLKAFGKCVYNVSRLSKGVNQIIVSEAAQDQWPTAPTGTMQFHFKALLQTNGYIATSTV